MKIPLETDNPAKAWVTVLLLFFRRERERGRASMTSDDFELEVTVCPAAEQVVDDKEDTKSGESVENINLIQSHLNRVR